MTSGCGQTVTWLLHAPEKPYLYPWSRDTVVIEVSGQFPGHHLGQNAGKWLDEVLVLVRVVLWVWHGRGMGGAWVRHFLSLLSTALLKWKFECCSTGYTSLIVWQPHKTYCHLLLLQRDFHSNNRTIILWETLTLIWTLYVSHKTNCHYYLAWLPTFLLLHHFHCHY